MNKTQLGIPIAARAGLQGIRSQRKGPSKKLQRFVRAEAAFSWVLLSLFQFRYSYDCSDWAELETFYCAAPVSKMLHLLRFLFQTEQLLQSTEPAIHITPKHLKFKFSTVLLLKRLLHLSQINLRFVNFIFFLQVLYSSDSSKLLLQLIKCND